MAGDAVRKAVGVVVPLVTPCRSDGEIDVTGLRAVCDDMVHAGVNALFVMGSTGRGPWFNQAERVKDCRAVRDCVGEQVPLYAGCMAPGLPGMLENARALAGAGANVAVVTAPGYFNYSQQEVESIFLRFADQSPLPVVVYDIPPFAGMKLDFDVVLRVGKHETVIGFKDSSADWERFQQILASFANRPEFLVMQGKEHLLLKSIQAGASGFVVSLVQINPAPFVRLYRAAVKGDQPTAEAMQRRIEDLLQIVVKCFERRPETSTIFHLMSAAMKKRGVCENLVLPHEGQTPEWLAAEAERALEILG